MAAARWRRLHGGTEPEALAAGATGGGAHRRAGVIRRPDWHRHKQEATDDGAPTSFRVVTSAVTALSTIIFGWFLTLGRLDLFQSRQMDDFYDKQGRSMLGGRFAAPEGTYFIEGFVVDGRTYTYFGPWPSLLRMPILALTREFDGRLTTVSMLLAFVVTMVATAGLYRRIREVVRSDAGAPPPPWGRRELVLAAALLFAFGAGSNVTFLGGKAWVYHEATLWGLAFTLLALDAVLRISLRPSRRAVIQAAIFTTLAFLSRGSIGVAPVAALALLALAHGVPGARRLVRSLTVPPRTGAAWNRPVGVRIAAAAVIPLMLFALVNNAKFNTLFTVPFGRQVISKIDEDRQATLAANGGNLFNVALVPTATVHYLRPDRIDVRAQWPFLTFSDRQLAEIGDVHFDPPDRTTGLPTLMPAFSLLAVVGLAATFRRRRPGDAELTLLRGPLLGSIAAALLTTTIAFVAQRYVTDMLPAVMLAALTGLHVLLRRWERFTEFPDRVVRSRRVWTAAIATLVVVGMCVTWALTWIYQREAHFPDVAAWSAGIEMQERVADVLGTSGPQFTRGQRLPRRAASGDVFVRGNCDGLWLRNFRDWTPIERGPGSGVHRFQVRLGDLPTSTVPVPSLTTFAVPPVPLVTIGTGDDALVVAVRRSTRIPDNVVVAAGTADLPLTTSHREGTDLADGNWHDLVVVADSFDDTMSIWVDGEQVWHSWRPAPPPSSRYTFGVKRLNDRTSDRRLGEVRAMPAQVSTCRRITG